MLKIVRVAQFAPRWKFSKLASQRRMGKIALKMGGWICNGDGDFKKGG